MVIDTEKLKDDITTHFNTETQKAADSGLSPHLKTMAQNNFQDSKIMALKQVEKFEHFMQTMEGILT